MRLILGNKPDEPTVKFNLEEDDGDINIMVEGKMVGYFQVHAGRVRLQIVRVNAPCFGSAFWTDENGFLEVRK